MASSEIYINQRDKNDDLYSVLQKETIDIIQKFSGKVWTDYNAHDPGITIMDILNYALTELNYKFDFPIEDYLAEKGKDFNPQDFGFFLPVEVLPTPPVTIDDYRKLLLTSFPELENVWIELNKSEGKYNINLKLYDFIDDDSSENIEDKVKKSYNANRNLCERINEINFVRLEEAEISAEINIHPEVDATNVLIEVYHRTYCYLGRHENYESFEKMTTGDISSEEWFDGSDSPSSFAQKTATQTELFQILAGIKGITSIHSCQIKNKNGKIINTFEKPFSLVIPKNITELNNNIRIKIDNSQVIIKFDHFISEFNKKIFTTRNHLNIQVEKPFSWTYPNGKFNNIFEHDTILDDFPEHYGINERGLPGNVSKERKSQAKQLKAYLYLFDMIFLRGLTELYEVGNILKLDYDNSKLLTPDTLNVKLNKELLINSNEEITKELYVKDEIKIKKQLLNFWDLLYGENSNPSYLAEYEYYDTYIEKIKRRIEFLKKIPFWGKNRFKAVDICKGQNEDNISGIKAYISALFGWKTEENENVGDIFNINKLEYIGDGEYNISNYLMEPDPNNIEQVTELFENYNEDNYEELRSILPFFINNMVLVREANIIDNGIFHGGTHLENYKIININENECLLAFWNSKKNAWISLGYSSDNNALNKETLNRMANILRHFLIKLNHESERMYVLEHIYFDAPEPYTVSIILPDWSARTSDIQFREIFKELLLSRLPAHIKADFYWFNPDEIKYFEIYWRQWRKAMNDEELDSAIILMNKIKDHFKLYEFRIKFEESKAKGIVEYISALLDWEIDDHDLIDNVFLLYNLTYIYDREYRNPDYITESSPIYIQIQEHQNVEPIIEIFEEYNEDNYRELRSSLSFFIKNRDEIDEGVFYGGIYFENYKIVYVVDEDYYALVFWNYNKEKWMLLESSSDKSNINKKANILYQFLLKLNSENRKIANDGGMFYDEGIYILEHIYFDPPEPYTISVILPNWSERMSNPQFQEVFMELILNRLSTNIKVNFYWLDWFDIVDYEGFLSDWRINVKQKKFNEAIISMNIIKEFLDKREDIVKRDEGNIYGAKACISKLFDWQIDEDKSIGDIFNNYKIKYIGEGKYEDHVGNHENDNDPGYIFDTDPIYIKMQNTQNTEQITDLFEEYSEEDYQELRDTLLFFVNNMTFDKEASIIDKGVFHGGIYLENYKIIYINRNNYALVLWNNDKDLWMLLGSSTNKKDLNKNANILRNFLLKLNLGCEGIHLIKHIYFNPDDLGISIIFPDLSWRMSNQEFFKFCNELVLSRLSQDLLVNSYWFDIDKISEFEYNWHKWKENVILGKFDEAILPMDRIKNILNIR